MVKNLLLTISLTLLFNLTWSQKVEITRPDGKRLSAEDIDRTVQQLIDTAEVTGLCIGIIQNNQPAYVKTYGYKNKTLNKFNSINTSFYAASFAKSLFAYMVMQLVDQRIIDLDKPLFHYLPKPLPEYENYKDLASDDRWKLITARHCLSHTTGFPNWRFLNPRDNQKLEIFFTPGSRYAYSGEGIYLLQMVIEVITGKDLESLAQSQVFTPFGMTMTSFVWQPAFASDYANGHNFEEDTFAVRKRNQSSAAGSMQTTINDFTNFMSAVLQRKGISETSWKEMFSPQIGIYTKRQFPSLNNDTTSQNKAINLSYGLGWGLFNTNYGRAFFKEGHSDDGWEHYLIAIPDKKTSLIIMSNSLNGESIYYELVEKLTGITIPWEWEGYTPYRGFVKLPTGLLEQYAGDYTGKIKVRLFVENGRLKAESPSEGLPKTGLYATDETKFFMKLIPVDVEFVKNKDGKVEKMKVNDEGEHYELKKVVAAATAEVKLSPSLISAYKGKYQLKGESRTLTVELKNNELLLNLPGQGKVQLAFYSNTQFKVKSAVVDIKGEFISENGKVTKMIIEQQGRFEWTKQ